MQKTILRLLFLCLCACAAWAQNTAQMHGVVQDATGAAVPAADVKATQTATGATRAVTTGADGGYILTNLPVGPYRLEVTKMGFTTYIQEGITLQVNADPLVDVALKVGAQTEQVTVEANAALVETRSQGVGQVVENQRILELPLNGRQVTDLITLSGAAVATQQTSDRFFGGQPFIAIGGGSPIGVDYSLDGSNHINFLSGVAMPIFFPDALQEFKVETSGLAANRGNASAVAVVTKSGTNQFHGSLFEFIRNNATNANLYNFGTAATPSTLKRNQYGGTIGGAIIKNKLFFFGGFQGTNTRADAASTQSFVPTDAMLRGDWSAFAACGNALPGAFVGGQINPSSFAAPAVFIVNKIRGGLSQTPNACGLVTTGIPRKLDETQYGGKVDYQINDRHSIFGRIVETTQYTPSTLTYTKDVLTASGIGIDSIAHSIALGDTYVISPTMVNAFRLGFNRTSSTRPGGQDYFSYCDAGVQNFWCGANPNFIGTLTVQGGFTMGTSFKEGNYNRPTSYNFTDDVNWIKGSHQITFGVGLLHGRFNQYNNFASGGQMTFSSLPNFMLGNMARLFQGLPNTHQIRQTNLNVYLTDTWKVNSRLTVNAGLRWEPYLPQSVTNGAIFTFDLNRYINGVKTTQFTNAPPGFYYPGDPGFPGNKGVNTQWAHFTPRIGLAWDPKGDGKTSIRASYAFGYAFLPGIWREDASGSNPFGGRTTVTTIPGGLVNPWQGIGNPFPYTVDKNATFTPSGLFLTPDPNYNQKTPTSQSWNLSIQRQFGTNWLASATYIGSLTQHIWALNPINPAIIVGPIAGGAGTCAAGSTIQTCSGTNNTDARRLFTVLRPTDGTRFGPVAQYDDGATQSYHGMLFSVQKRLSNGISISGNYTLSHCIGNFADINANGPPADESYIVPNNRNFDRGNCDIDRRHLLNLTASGQTPKFANKALTMVGSGWKLSGIYRVTSGSPININYNTTDRALSGTLRQRPNLVAGVNPYGDTSGRPNTSYFNPAAFSLPALGTYGNLGWNALTGPGSWNLDLSLARAFRIKEGQSIEIRAEAYNVTNSFRPAFAISTNQNGSVSATTTANAGTGNFANPSQAIFGQIRGALDPRIMQFALKYTF
ncbi:MAG: carboxypeptidase regulatory-like domain-containing protein [Bryobacteraceae bacterium]